MLVLCFDVLMKLTLIVIFELAGTRFHNRISDAIANWLLRITRK